MTPNKKTHLDKKNEKARKEIEAAAHVGSYSVREWIKLMWARMKYDSEQERRGGENNRL